LVQTKPLADQITPLVQRQVEPEEEEEEEEEFLEAKRLPGPIPEVTSSMEARISSLRGGGQPLDRETRAYMEPRFGHDFSRVRVHADGEAAEAARLVNAQAFTVGKDMVFGAGQYAPSTPQGQRLVAHELTHVVQQNGVNVNEDSRLVNNNLHKRNGIPKLINLRSVQNVLQRQNADECTYGEISSWAIISSRDFSPPAGLADAKASIGAVCVRNPCLCIDGSRATAPADRAAWQNIVNATGGTDQTGGGNFMCVGTENCWFVRSCYRCINGRRTLVNRTNNLTTSGTTAVTGKGTLYFYNDPLRGWCNREDYRSGCRS
jgi:hypothetical protein